MSRAAAPLLAVGLLLVATTAATRDLPLPGPSPRPPRGEVRGIGAPTDARCATCHQEIAAEWRASQHRTSWEDDYFLRSYAREPLAFCRSCHAPESPAAEEPSAAARSSGVGCTTCHVGTTGVVGARGHVAAGPRDHDVIADPRLATAAACARCHQFDLPSVAGIPAGPMQDTHGEHARSAHATTPCQACHMPEIASAGGGSHRSHAFRVQGDAAMMARGVNVRSATLVGDQLRLDLAPGAIGHAFPTGDLHRRAEVRATPVDAAGRAIATPAIEVLGRTFAAARRGPVTLPRVQVSDTRLASPRTLTLRVPPAARAVQWEIVWQRLPPDLAASLGMTMKDQEMVVARGTVRR